MGTAIKVELGDGGCFYGFESPCPDWLLLKYREAVKFICSDCHKHENEVGRLEAHRIKRGCEGGLYTVLPLGHMHSNVKPCCKKCHQRYNYSRKINY